MTLITSDNLMWLVALAALLLTVFYSLVLRREGRKEYRLTWPQVALLWCLRLTVAGLVLVALARPAYVHMRTEERLPVVPILVDESRSMSFPEARENPLAESQPASRRSRFHTGQTVVERLQKPLSRTHRVRIYTFSDGLELLKEPPHLASDASRALTRAEIFETHDEPTGDHSNIGDALTDVLNDLEGEKVSGVVLLSDGRQTGGRKLDTAADQLSAAQVPLHAVVFGSEFPLRDLRIDEVVAGAEASLGDVLTFHVKVTNQISASLVTELLLEEKDARQEASPFQTVAKRNLTLSRGQQTVAISTIPETEGPRRFRFSLPRQPDEVSLDNNTAEVTVNVVKRTLKVLLIAGEPSREFYYLVPALLRDPVIDLSCYLQNADVDYVQQGNSVIERLPATVKEWSSYDVAILFDVDPNGVSTQQLTGLEDMVGGGGGLLVVAGRTHGLAKLLQVHAARIRGMLPVEVDKNLHLDHDRVYDQPYKVARTTAGRNHPILMAAADPRVNDETWNSFDQLDFYWHHPVAGPKPKAIVLLAARGGSASAAVSPGTEGTPLMAIHRYVDGAVLYLGVNDLWRWRFPAESYDYDRLWTRAIRYLGESRLLGTQQQVTLATDRRTYSPGDDVQIQLRVLDPALMAQLSGQPIHAGVRGDDQDVRMVQLSADLQGEPLYHGTYRTRRLGSMIVQTRYTPPDADSEAKPLFDVQHGFQVRMQSLEEADTRANLAGMQQMAERTGGKYLDYRSMQDLTELIAAIPTEPQLLRSTRVDEVWDGTGFLCLFLVLVSGELSLRKWWGLL